MDALRARFVDRVLGVATMHGKERVIGPALMKALPIAGYQAIPEVDTDRFGAFSGEVQRQLDPRATAIEKAKHGAEVSGMELVIASEGSFGPYPPAPFISCNEEFLALYDARDGAVFEHKHLTLETNFGGEACSTPAQVTAFAQRMRFPEHALVLRSTEHWRADSVQVKGIHQHEELLRTANDLLAAHGTVWVETDMRAMCNPTRMKMIGATAERFAAELIRTCPRCSHFYFRITSAVPGLPCGLCGSPTESVRSFVRHCQQCDFTTEEPRTDGKQVEEPQFCGYCNP